MDLDTTLVVHSNSSEGPSVPSKEQLENTIDIVSQKDKTAKASGLSNLADAQYANRIKRNAKICERGVRCQTIRTYQKDDERN